MAIRAMYTLSAAVAIVSNVFLISLVVMPDPAPVSGLLWPKPSQYCHGHRTISISDKFEIKIPPRSSSRLQDAASRYQDLILKSTFVSPIPVNPDDLQREDRSKVAEAIVDSVQVRVEDSKGNDPLGMDTDESYQLLIATGDEDDESEDDFLYANKSGKSTSSGAASFEISSRECNALESAKLPAFPKILLKAPTIYGAMRGLETLSQLIVNSALSDPGNGATKREIPSTPIRIHDRPLFKHRGVLVDSSRNFLSMRSLYRTLDAMSYNKFNVLHWHLTDSPSFPLQLDDTKNLPLSDLAGKGSYSPEKVYSKEEVSDFVEYAASRGIRVIPELDMPGHAWSWSHAFPEITTCLDGYPSYSQFCAEPPCGQLNPVLSKTYKVVDAVYKQVLPLFPETFVHAGSDEVNINCWNSTKSIQQFMKAKGLARNQRGFDFVLDEFVSRQHESIRKNGDKVPIVWEEPLLNHDLDTLLDNKDTVVQVWTSAANTKKVIEKGHRVITGSADYWYLDCGFGAWLGNWTTGTSWCDPYKTWQKIYSFSPISDLTPKEAESVLGGEALLWGEQVDDTNLDQKLWPRASAAAEVLWSGNSEDSSTFLWNGPAAKTDTLRSNEAHPRILEHRFRMLSRGISAEPLSPEWCSHNPGHCDWSRGDPMPANALY